MMLARGNIEFDLLIILYFSNDIFIKARAMPINRPYVEPQSYTESTSATVA